MKKKNILIIIIALVGIIGAFFAYGYMKNYSVGNVAKNESITLKAGLSEEEFWTKLNPVLKDPELFRNFAQEKNLFSTYKKGRYLFKEGMTNRELVTMLQLGEQEAMDFRIIDFDNVYQMVGRVSKKTEADSLTFVKELDRIALEKNEKNAEGLKKYFFIDTYKFFWTVTPKEFFETFEKQYQEFWNASRMEKEKASGLTRDQIYALASIVYKESGGKKDEMQTIAGLYLNRFRKGMKLQSDPTVIYAVNNGNNFSNVIKRVYYKDLKTPSPYNTYMVAGIPPGPICVTDQSSVDAVLNAEKNNYIYMCANPAKPGYHKFTADAQEHMKNAKEYQQWLNDKNIK